MKSALDALRGRSVRAVLFDLDGTLLDTVGDIACALNRALVEAGYAPRSLAAVRDGVGRGAAVLIERVLADAPPDASVAAQLLQRFLAHYAALHEQGQSQSRAFAGVQEGVEALVAQGAVLGVVTNKQHALALAALEHAGLLAHFAVVVGGDTCSTRKPHPGPLLYALERLNARADEAIMVGDSANDVQAARAAGLPVLCVPYGYTEGGSAHDLPCDALIESVAVLPALLERCAA